MIGSFWKKWFIKKNPQQKRLVSAIYRIVGSKPSNILLYELAFRHTSASVETPNKNFRLSNERLEYLGDAFLGAIVAEFLYKKYPYKDEGFLTEIRSRIVNRESLNNLGKKIGLNQLIAFEGVRYASSHKSMAGDAMEAFIGAVYLDKGFAFTKKFIVKRLIQPHLDLDKIVSTNTNFKSILIEWVQRAGKEVDFEIINEQGDSHHKYFTAQVTIDSEPISTGTGQNKKKAEQAAAEQACKILAIKQ